MPVANPVSVSQEDVFCSVEQLTCSFCALIDIFTNVLGRG